MNLFKTHISFIFPLFIICFCFQFAFFIDELIKDYETKLNKDYSVVLVSELEIQAVDLANIEYFSSINELDPSEILNKLKKDITNANLNTLKSKLPKFYNISFTKFINENEINQIKKQLLKIPNVLKVETFSKTHIKIYKLLNIIKLISYICLICISILSIALFIKQIKIFKYEHENRIYILNLFGANFFQRAAPMLKIVFVDNIICFALLFAFFINFNNISYIKEFLAKLDIDLPQIDFLPSLIEVSSYSLLASLLCIMIVMFKVKRQ
ncbi:MULTISPECIES: ABC transporter permease [unclassified Campylobacter]|uniref:ABC transporter permease n=1 Tax=unclassified Campylobacter TaxID=2593542 RepID=UPI001BDA34B1|nr:MULTISPECIES: ABC transporter permease [unclassified Campylobacter]MBZ7975955.1 ABC transporter permease [Campylobacter sp. RM12637]MBZ7977525.1 ABC transporter permease [Campylobacter sp. RM12654]MBZ7979506.1 ABC transporter permease [Campylobacter sp. RM12642]MBZ7981177.1 ABC transporter permease [Campylobacter sp. RM12640]MBZ7983018.1 ABC transporter permease [Campylobacter sp. RM12647]MBZ7988736.1 ABC transporter permease [Campylobacter sp. RM12635]MBZ7990392.1 ABC transporter permeas